MALFSERISQEKIKNNTPCCLEQDDGKYAECVKLFPAFEVRQNLVFGYRQTPRTQMDTVNAHILIGCELTAVFLRLILFGDF